MFTMTVMKDFFMWCSIFNGAIFVLWTMVILYAPDWVYSIHSKWFKLSRESFDTVIYAMMGLYKLTWIFFNLIPFVVLSMLV